MNSSAEVVEKELRCVICGKRIKAFVRADAEDKFICQQCGKKWHGDIKES